MLQDRNKSAWAYQVRSILNICGLTDVWNVGKRTGIEEGNVEKSVKGVLEHREIWKNGSAKLQPWRPLGFIGNGRRSGDVIYILKQV